MPGASRGDAEVLLPRGGVTLWPWRLWSCRILSGDGAMESFVRWPWLSLEPCSVMICLVIGGQGRP